MEFDIKSDKIIDEIPSESNFFKKPNGTNDMPRSIRHVISMESQTPSQTPQTNDKHIETFEK